VILFVVSVFAGLTTGGISLLLASPDSFTTVELKRILAIGYTAAAFILLFMSRIARAYLRLDGFRRELLSAIRAEQKRIEALKELRPSVLTSPAQSHPIEHKVAAG
jgi:hypothetical protein